MTCETCEAIGTQPCEVDDEPTHRLVGPALVRPLSRRPGI